MASRFFELEEKGAGQPAKQVALVVGNGAYDFNRLLNPPRDALHIKAALEALGFRTEQRLDAGKQVLEEAIVELGRRAAAAGDGGISFFYFAGHGIQLRPARHGRLYRTVGSTNKYPPQGVIPLHLEA
jgi:uncharacterized caspase-like protein